MAKRTKAVPAAAPKQEEKAPEAKAAPKPVSKPTKSKDQLKAEELGIEYVLWKPAKAGHPAVYSFKCPANGCPFDSVEMSLLLTHIEKVHLSKPARAEAAGLIQVASR